MLVLDSNQYFSMAGAFLVLWAFLAVNFWQMNREGFLYAFLNFLGTALLAVSVWEPFNFGIFIVEAIWSAASLWMMIKFIRHRHVGR